ncbi:MAG: hypothetical protein DRJ10_00325 [Bacteroidetes bacterium]|nr:MAG: hypothetical protein DRJ10_00325 [Bacteroidota bacterium]
MKQKTHYPTKYYIRIIAWLVFTVFAFIFRIKKKMPAEVKNLKSPYLVLGNHVGHWDPFVTGNFLPHYTHFVSSEAAFRSPFNNFFLTRLGTIPKKKNIRDTKVIRDIISVIRQGENVGIFPEAVRNWAGSSFTLDPSIVKLIKLLNVPVVVPILKGMNLFNPRWSAKLRYSRVEVEYELLFKANELKNLSEEEIYSRLSNALKHDEVEYQRTKMNKIYSKYKAENINHALYVCPDCHAIDSFRTKGNDFKCVECNYDIRINQFGFFERISSGKLFFDNIRDWYYWEEKWLLNYVNKKLETHYEGILFEDKNSQIFVNNELNQMEYLANANIKLYVNRIVFEWLEKKEIWTLKLTDIQTINPQVNDQLELIYKGKAYRSVGERPGVSALKWEVAMNALWKKTGQEHKLSSFIQQELSV